ncbi:hypothetical protein F4823DRAFT_611949 [Ustulina deusta]|nr:hypothetical protein F4823DRAFT_611949 [Ustulina deusta]
MIPFPSHRFFFFSFFPFPFSSLDAWTIKYGSSRRVLTSVCPTPLHWETRRDTPFPQCVEHEMRPCYPARSRLLASELCWVLSSILQIEIKRLTGIIS